MKIEFNKLKKVPKKEVKSIHHILYDLTKKGHKVYEGYAVVHGLFNFYGIFKTYICDNKERSYVYEELLKDGQMYYRPIQSVDNNFITIKPTIQEAESAVANDWSKQTPKITYTVNY